MQKLWNVTKKFFFQSFVSIEISDCLIKVNELAYFFILKFFDEKCRRIRWKVLRYSTKSVEIFKEMSCYSNLLDGEMQRWSEEPKGFLITWLSTSWFSYVWDGLISAGMQRPGPDQPLWDRSVPSICWPRNEAVFQLSSKLIFWSYGDDRGIKHLRHGRTEMADGSSTHGMTEPEMTEHGELWMRLLNPRGDEDLGPRWTSVDGPIDRTADGLIDGILRVGNFLYNEVSRDVTTHNTEDCGSRVLMIERSQK
jgi:hypothetical protein